ncbi:cytochrome P460 family protein [Arhodomonas sp. SL1]|uniref:cytochrome P460 family protein n=1 Tax=Arhodomonas sp. SL1 TaxID=3425691 RepID=UPI003F885D68
MKSTSIIATIGALTFAAGLAHAEAPFGTRDDVNYAKQLWAQMEDAGLVGKGSVMSTPYGGQHPHGAVLDTVDTTLEIDGNRGTVIVKRNYGGDGVSESAVADDPGQWLQSVTVMYRRDGYDPDNQDWFWAKYQPDGSLERNPKDMPLAGRVAKGADQGCIACHTAAPGEDYVFNNDRFQ